MTAVPNLASYIARAQRLEPMSFTGEVVELVGLLVKSNGPTVGIGDFCEIRTSGGRSIRAQVVGFRNGHVLSLPLEEIDGLQMGDPVIARHDQSRIGVGPDLLGRVLDGLGRPMDAGPAIRPVEFYELSRRPPSPLEREHIEEPLATGIRVVDGLLPCGKGQRIGIFGGSGVGKSTLLGAMSRHSSADVNVIVLVGERNREVRAFLEHDLGPEGMKRSVVVTATSDRPAPLRVRSCFIGLAIAEYFRDQGADVLLVMDSITRLAMAQREIGLAAGEPPSQRGYTPSVFNLLPRLFERAGNFRRGSITGFFTVLVEGDDFQEPVCDAVRALLDGHIILARQLAASGHYPAVDVLHSVSRLTSQLLDSDQLQAAHKVREALAIYDQSRDLIDLGAYVAGSNPRLDASIRVQPEFLRFLRQNVEVRAPRDETMQHLDRLRSLLA